VGNAWKVLAIMLGFMALQGAIGERSPRFIRGAIEHGEPIMEFRFTGIEWPCGKDSCWAGRVLLNHLTGETELATGRARTTIR
jgi:hypothetical protein